MTGTRPALLAALLLISGATCAQQAAETVDLPGVMSLVRDASPVLALERQGVAQAEAARIIAGAQPNPTVNYGRFMRGGGQPTIFEGSRQQQAGIELPLLVAGQRAARIERAELAIEAARARVAAGASSLSAEAAAAFVALLAAQERASLIESAVRETTRLRDIVAGREQSGVASRYEVTRVDVELGGLRARADEASAEVAQQSGLLAALLALPSWRPRASGSLASLLSAPTNAQPVAGTTNPAVIANATPAVVAAVREEAAALRGVEVARRERFPVPALSVVRSWSSEPFGAANFVGLSVELPLLDNRRGVVAQAEAEARSASLRREIAQSQAAAGVERLSQVISARQAALARFDTEAAARLTPLRQMAEDAYRLGRGSILELIDATRSRFELEQTRITLAAALAEARLRLWALEGAL